MILKEMLIVVLGMLLIGIILGMSVTLKTNAWIEAQKMYQKTSLGAVEKKIRNIDLYVDLYHTFNYTLYSVINTGGIMSPKDFINKIYDTFTELVKNYPHTYSYNIELDPEILNFSSGQSSEINLNVKININGEEVSTEKIYENIKFASDIRAEFLYEKAYMFYRHVLKGKGIHCFSWDGNSKITLTFYTFKGDPGRVHIHWNLTQAELENWRNGVYQNYPSKLYEAFECTLLNGESCEIYLDLKDSKATVYRTDMEDSTSECFDLSCGNFLPTLIEKGKPYEICINSRINLPEKIREEVENNCREGCLPRAVQGSTSCSFCPDELPNPAWAVAVNLGCTEQCPLNVGKEKAVSCLKNKLKNFIQQIVDEVAQEETDEETEWEITVNIDSLSYTSTKGSNCLQYWTEACGKYKCAPCDCPEKDEDSNKLNKLDGGTSEGGWSGPGIIGGGKSGKGGGLAPVEKNFPIYLFTKFSKKSLIWNFTYRDGGDATEVQPRSCSIHSNRKCPEPPDCSCNPGCTGGGYESRCIEKTLYEYSYSYSYAYQYELDISIKDKKRDIILTGE